MSVDDTLTVIVLSIVFTLFFYIVILPLLDIGFAKFIELVKRIGGR